MLGLEVCCSEFSLTAKVVFRKCKYLAAHLRECVLKWANGTPKKLSYVQNSEGEKSAMKRESHDFSHSQQLRMEWQICAVFHTSEMFEHLGLNLKMHFNFLCYRV